MAIYRIQRIFSNIKFRRKLFAIKPYEIFKRAMSAAKGNKKEAANIISGQLDAAKKVTAESQNLGSVLSNQGVRLNNMSNNMSWWQRNITQRGKYKRIQNLQNKNFQEVASNNRVLGGYKEDVNSLQTAYDKADRLANNGINKPVGGRGPATPPKEQINTGGGSQKPSGNVNTPPTNNEVPKQNVNNGGTPPTNNEVPKQNVPNVETPNPKSETPKQNVNNGGTSEQKPGEESWWNKQSTTTKGLIIGGGTLTAGLGGAAAISSMGNSNSSQRAFSYKEYIKTLLK